MNTRIAVSLYIAGLDIKYACRRLIQPAMIRIDKYRLRTNHMQWVHEDGQITGIYNGTWTHARLDRMMFRWAKIFNAHTILRDNNDIVIFAQIREDSTNLIIRGYYI